LIGRMRDGRLFAIKDNVETESPTFAPVRMMFIHYANQSVNDLFETPNKNYTPPRTFMQTTMRDPRGTYCSRPDATDEGLPAGYMYAIRAHVETGLACVVAFSGGCLSLLAQDSKYEVRRDEWVDDM